MVLTQVRSFAFLLDLLRERVVKHLGDSIDFILELSQTHMLRFELLILLLFEGELVLHSVQLVSDFPIGSALIINLGTAVSAFNGLPVGVLELQRSCQETERLAAVDLPEHEGLGERYSTSATIGPLFQLSEVGLRDRGGTWDAPVGRAAKSDVKVLFVALQFLVRGSLAGSASIKSFSATGQHSDNGDSSGLTQGTKLGLQGEERLNSIFFSAQDGVGLIVAHDAMACVVDEV